MLLFCAAAGLPTFVVVTVQGDTEGIFIQRFALLDMNGNVIFETAEVIPLGNIYGIFNFSLPVSTFQVQISGVDGLGNQVSRISTAGAQSSTVGFRLGKIYIDCKISACIGMTA